MSHKIPVKLDHIAGIEFKVYKEEFNSNKKLGFPQI